MKRILTQKESKLIKRNFPKGIAHTESRNALLLGFKRHGHGVRKCLIVDGMNIAYQAFYAYAKLSYKGKSTSILYGFTQILSPILKQYEPEKVIICWDGFKHPERVKCLPQYKTHREIDRQPKARKRFLNQIKRVRKQLRYLGIPQWYSPKVEGDDMVYLATKRYQAMYNCIIISCDKDFKQLINNEVSVYNPRTKYLETLWAFPANNYGIEVPQYKDFLCLIGDKSDDIPGYPGIGEKRAANLLAKYYSIKSYLESDEDIAGLTDKDKLRKVYLRNNKMINLRFFDKKFNKGAKPIFELTSPQLKLERYKSYCMEYGLKTSVFPKFLEPFLKLNEDE